MGRSVTTARWAAMTSVMNLIVQVIGIITALVVARVIGPQDYGVAAMVATASVFANLLCELGLGPALLSRRIDGSDQIAAAQTLLWGFGLLLVVFFWLTAPAFAVFYDEPSLRIFVPYASIGIFLSAVRAVPIYRLLVQDQVVAYSLITIVVQIIGALAGVTGALLGYGPWAIVGPPVLMNLVKAVLCYYYAGMLPTFGSLRHLAHIWPEVRAVSLLQVSEYVMLQTDKVVIGRVYGAADLGRYALAYAVLMRPVVLFAHSITAVTIRMFSDVADDLQRFGHGAVRSLTYVSRIATPILIGGSMLAPEIVSGFLGLKWQGSIQLVQIFFIAGAAHVLSAAFAPLWLALGWNTVIRQWAIWVNLGTGVALCTMALTLPSIEAMALGYAAISVVGILPLRVILSTRNGLSLPGLVSAWMGVARDCLIMALAVAGVLFALNDSNIWLRMVAAVATGIVTYSGCFALFDRTLLREILDLVRNMMKRD